MKFHFPLYARIARPRLLSKAFIALVGGALLLYGCASTPEPPEFASKEPPVIVHTAQRAIPTQIGNAIEPAMVQHVLIDSGDPNLRSLQTISDADAKANELNTASELQVRTLAPVYSAPNQFITLAGSSEENPSTLQAAAGESAQPQVFAEINFKRGTTEMINPERLDNFIRLASRLDGLFYIVGYADETGTYKSNVALSHARAVLIMEKLTAAGVHPTRIQARGAGVSNTYGNPDLNRRASVSFRVAVN
jgi:outer membrane protein OmpA-like peptidoglycan-associated protein